MQQRVCEKAKMFAEAATGGGLTFNRDHCRQAIGENDSQPMCQLKAKRQHIDT